MKRQLRYIQTLTPALRPAKFAAQNAATRLFGLHMDVDFRALSHLRPVGLALDIGGNWGQSIHALKRCANPRRIISFEPNADLADRLRCGPSVEVQRFALSDSPGEMTLYVPRYRGFVYDGLASLDPDEARAWLNPRTMAWFNPADLHIDAQTVPVRTLDSLNLAPDVVKIDVQGMEEQVVRGGYRTFRDYRPATIIENPSASLTALMAEFGLKPYLFDGQRLGPHHGHWKNTLFLTDEHVARIGQ